ncbi:MAG: phosphoenolpyruvate mutase [Myxococcales bacterium]|nr:phosphoenolpyruvate mutase [Myxococcales bacterium]
MKGLLRSKEIAVLMEAHNGLTAKLVEEAGFEAIWGSGLSISAALGVRDSNEASWTQVLEVLEFMNDATALPILLDGDTGYGNFNNVRRLVTKLEQRGIAGVCLEDKLFPKTNSFIDGERQALAEIDEFCGKIRAAKDTQLDPDFQIVARTEAFIAGWGLQEALLRATAYAESGADVILVHSKRKDSKEIMDFMAHWSLDTPVVIVPTKYPTEPIASFVEAGITNFIFANQTVRTVISAVQKNLRLLRQTNDLMSVEKEIAKVDEIFRLQDVQELQQSEELYLPHSQDEETKALILAATKGNFGSLVADRPKCMLYLKRKPILSWHVENLNRQGVKTIGVVRGYKKEAVNLSGLHYFDNDEYDETGELFSLYKARDFLKGDMLIAYGDVIYDSFILQNLLTQGTSPLTIAVDAGWALRGRRDKEPDLVATRGECSPVKNTTCVLEGIGKVPASQATGEWIGLFVMRGSGTELVARTLDEMARDEPAMLRKSKMDELFRRLIAKGETIEVVHTFGHWQDLDEEADLLESRPI